MNYKQIAVYILIVAVVAFSEFQFEEKQDLEFSQKELQQFSGETILNSYPYKFDTNKTYGMMWDIKNEKLAFEQTSSKTKKSVKVSLNAKENSICLNSSCYKILAIKFIENTPSVVFYNKDLDKKIVVFQNGETIDSALMIKEISQNRVLLEEQENEKTWRLQLFDVNQTKYLPKEKDEN